MSNSANVNGSCVPLVLVGRVVLEGVAPAVEELGADAELVARARRLLGRRGRGLLRGGAAQRAQRVVRQHGRAGG